MSQSISFGPSVSGGEHAAHGVLVVHACARAMTPHVQWALGELSRASVDIQWSSQPVAAGQARAEVLWGGSVGTAAAITSALRGFPIHYEVIEYPSVGRSVDSVVAERFSVVPGLGVHRSVMNGCGETLITESRLRAAMAKASASRGDSDISSLTLLLDELAVCLGEPWDDELEPLRFGVEASDVTETAGARVLGA